MPKRVLWMSRHKPTQRQVDALRQMHGGDTLGDPASVIEWPSFLLHKRVPAVHLTGERQPAVGSVYAATSIALV